MAHSLVVVHSLVWCNVGWQLSGFQPYKDVISRNELSKQEDRFPYMVGLLRLSDYDFYASLLATIYVYIANYIAVAWYYKDYKGYIRSTWLYVTGAIKLFLQ